MDTHSAHIAVAIDDIGRRVGTQSLPADSVGYERLLGWAADKIARETGGRAFAVPADLSQAADIAAWHAATVRELGAVDLLFANTGGPPAGSALAFDDASWQAAFDSLSPTCAPAVAAPSSSAHRPR